MGVSLEAWKQKVLAANPGASFTEEDGTGKTYDGETGDWVAHTGPDMQADVVGVYIPGEEWGWYLKDGDSFDAVTDTPEFPG